MHKSQIFIFKGCMISVNSCLLFSDGWVQIGPSFVFCQVWYKGREKAESVKKIKLLF